MSPSILLEYSFLNFLIIVLFYCNNRILSRNKTPAFSYKAFLDTIVMLMKHCITITIVAIIITLHHIITPIIEIPCYRTREMSVKTFVVSAIYYRFLDSVSNGKSTIVRVAAEDSNLTSGLCLPECYPITPNCEGCRMISSTVLKTFHNFITQRFLISISSVHSPLCFYYLLLRFHIVATGIEPMKRR